MRWLMQVHRPDSVTSRKRIEITLTTQGQHALVEQRSVLKRSYNMITFRLQAPLPNVVREISICPRFSELIVSKAAVNASLTAARVPVLDSLASHAGR